MIEKHALLFAQSVQWMSDAKALCGYSNAVAHGENAGCRELVLRSIAKMRAACILSDMDAMLPVLDRLERNVVRKPPFPGMNLSALAQEIENVISFLKDTLEAEYYFHVDGRDVPLFVEQEPFGPAVARKFPRAAEDIQEAGKCLALQRPTATVFHLMRAMEVAVQRAGRRLGVTNVDKEWGKILSDIGRAVEALPKATEAEKRKRNNWSEAHVHLYHVKQAWRNNTMHPRTRYTREQAQEVYSATRASIAHLATLV